MTTLQGTLDEACFHFGKGLPEGHDFLARVVALGFEAGFAAGAVAGCIYLFANNARPGLPRVSYHVLCRLMLPPILAAMIMAGLLTTISQFIQPNPLERRLDGLLDATEARAFLTVWTIHIGLYAGLAMGVLIAVLQVRRRRHELAAGTIMN